MRKRSVVALRAVQGISRRPPFSVLPSAHTSLVFLDGLLRMAARAVLSRIQRPAGKGAVPATMSWPALCFVGVLSMRSRPRVYDRQRRRAAWHAAEADRAAAAIAAPAYGQPPARTSLAPLQDRQSAMPITRSRIVKPCFKLFNLGPAAGPSWPAALYTSSSDSTN